MDWDLIGRVVGGVFGIGFREFRWLPDHRMWELMFDAYGGRRIAFRYSDYYIDDIRRTMGARRASLMMVEYVSQSVMRELLIQQESRYGLERPVTRRQEAGSAGNGA